MFFRTIKRTADIFGSLIGIIILILIYPFIALAIKLDSFFSVIPDPAPLSFQRKLESRKSWIPHQVRNDTKITGITKSRYMTMINSPVLIKLSRISSGKIIRVYKFRSMKPGTHQLKYADLAHLNERKDGPFFKIKNDPRLTRTGKILRKFRLDEFPQFINVLKGDLSLVGPRPHEPEEISKYPEKYRHLPLAKAGITGYSQVNGASSLPFLKELELDDYYVRNQSLWFDAKIILKTFLILLIDPTAV